jgi:carbon storage regulator
MEFEIAAPRLLVRKGNRMLVLSRKRNEQIVIGENIVVTVVDVRGDKVRLGVDAPQDVPIHRHEIHDAIQKESGGTSSRSARANVSEIDEG